VASGHLFCGYSKSFEAKNITFSKESRKLFYQISRKIPVFAKYINSQEGV
jgi:hypothetical protein